MSSGKNPFLRYRLLNLCFSSREKRYWTLNELRDKLLQHDLVIEKRSLIYDIENMRHDERLGYFAPIRYCRRNRAYHYTDPGFSIEKLSLCAEELDSLNIVREVLKPYAHLPFVRDFESIHDRLLSPRFERPAKPTSR